VKDRRPTAQVGTSNEWDSRNSDLSVRNEVARYLQSRKPEKKRIARLLHGDRSDVVLSHTGANIALSLSVDGPVCLEPSKNN
jgi:signal transduction histidine kinase